MNLKMALQVSPYDNVATIFADNIKKGDRVEIRDKQGNTAELIVKDDIPYGHKIASKDIKVKEPIIKYGEEIGVATKDICVGDYVHVHNLDSMRGRGDL